MIFGHGQGPLYKRHPYVRVASMLVWSVPVMCGGVDVMRRRSVHLGLGANPATSTAASNPIAFWGGLFVMFAAAGFVLWLTIRQFVAYRRLKHKNVSLRKHRESR